MNRKALTGFDLLVIILVIALSLCTMAFGLFKSNGNKAVISVDEQVIAEYNLVTYLKREVKTNYGLNTVVISNGECFVSVADCRDGICVSRGKISKIGESIVCLPHKLIVEIK